MKLVTSVLFTVAFLFSRCFPTNSGCTTEYRRSGGPTIEINGIETPQKYGTGFSFVLLEPKVYYDPTVKISSHSSAPGFPLLVNTEKMVFSVLNNNIEVDTLSLEYKIIPKYMPKDGCKDERYIAAVEIKKCYSTNHIFRVNNCVGYDED
ncbi:MAG: hypothetical protein EBZ58_12125 [Bacteroidetes bacterium]|nr:hypothetical protein [Bacteroidota bacterium]